MYVLNRINSMYSQNNRFCYGFKHFHLFSLAISERGEHIFILLYNTKPYRTYIFFPWKKNGTIIQRRVGTVLF